MDINKQTQNKELNKSGLVVKSISGEYTVYNIQEQSYTICKPRGLFRHRDETVKVGDYVTYNEDTKIINSINKRKNDLIRPVIANVDKAFVVTSLIDPDLNLNLLDKILCVLEFNNIIPVLIFTKIDLLDDKNKYDDILNYYQSVGYKVYKNDINLKEILYEEIENCVCVLAGQSGVGKSTLINTIDESLNLKTNDISRALGRGKHTTRHIELFKFGNGFLADSPGFGNLSFEGFDDLALSHSFVEFYNNTDKCKYNCCLHLNEPRCEIKKLVNEKKILKSRYDNYLLFSKELKDKKKY